MPSYGFHLYLGIAFTFLLLFPILILCNTVGNTGVSVSTSDTLRLDSKYLFIYALYSNPSSQRGYLCTILFISDIHKWNDLYWFSQHGTDACLHHQSVRNCVLFIIPVQWRLVIFWKCSWVCVNQKNQCYNWFMGNKVFNCVNIQYSNSSYSWY